jgi:hypothetical protein
MWAYVFYPGTHMQRSPNMPGPTGSIMTVSFDASFQLHVFKKKEIQTMKERNIANGLG